MFIMVIQKERRIFIQHWGLGEPCPLHLENGQPRERIYLVRAARGE
jgi:hypothetical protein